MKRKKMKKWMSATGILLSMAMGLSACGGSGSGNEGGSNATAGNGSGSNASAGGSVTPGEWHVEENTLPIANGDIELSIYCGIP